MPEVIVVVAVLVLLLLAALMALPRGRENARSAACRRNLMQIGIALALYDGSEGALPSVPELRANPAPTGGPLWTILQALALPDLTELTDVAHAPERRPGQVPGARPVPGFVCPSATFPAGPSAFPGPISYRATAGDQTGGVNGGFAPGRSLRLADVEAGDGQSYTAAFSERRPGNGRDGPDPSNYRFVPVQVDEGGCPPGGPGSWRGDAGSLWAEAAWRSTLYNHALRPDALTSCVEESGRSALLGASSPHSGGVNVLVFDGSVRAVRPTVAPPVWKALATTHSPEAR